MLLLLLPGLVSNVSILALWLYAYSIPTFSPTNDSGACSANAEAAADSSRCWWTCGGCVRDTDITTCPDKLTWGLTYDDGPAPYTPDLLQYLDAHDLKTTFFVVGSRVIERPTMLVEEYMQGHEISVHTWSHHVRRRFFE